MSNNKNSLPLCQRVCQTRGNHNNKTPNGAPNMSLLLAEIILPAESPAALSDCAVKLLIPQLSKLVPQTAEK